MMMARGCVSNVGSKVPPRPIGGSQKVTETNKFCLICGGYRSRLWPDIADILGCDNRAEGACVSVTKYIRHRIRGDGAHLLLLER